MWYREDKWFHRIINLLPAVESYQTTMNVLIDRSVPKRYNDERLLSEALLRVSEMLYQQLYQNLLERRPGREASREEKVVFNCSITQLKRERIKAHYRIAQKFNYQSWLLKEQEKTGKRTKEAVA